MLVVQYSKEGKAISDFEVESFVMSLKPVIEEIVEYEIDVSSEIVILCLRLFVKRGIINHKNVCFHFEGTDIYIDKFGNLSEWPKDFCHKFDSFLDKILAL